MKTMKRFLALLLFFVAAMNVQTLYAQTNGDVNNDGTVNEADITAISEIMKEANGVGPKKYYWYAGQIEPTSMTSNPTPSSTYTCNNWFEIGTTLPTSIVKQVTGGTSGKAWYAAIPTDAGLVAVTSADTPDTSIIKQKTITINGVKYDVWYAGGITASRYNVRFK